MKRVAHTVICLVYLIPLGVQGQTYIGPATAATAGTGRASVSPLDGPYLNPASIAHLSKYYLGMAAFTDPDHQADRERGWGVFVTDSGPEAMVAAALGYVNVHHDVADFDGVDEQDIQLTLAGHIFSGVTFGLAGHHLIQDSVIAHRMYTNNLSAGLLYTPHPSWGIGLVSTDFLPPNDDVPLVIRHEPSLGFGVNYLFDTFLRAKADIVHQQSENPNNKYAYMMGIESYIWPELVVRVGYQRDELLDRKIYGAGLGFEGPKFTLDYAAQIIDGEGGTRHLIDLWAAF